MNILSKENYLIVEFDEALGERDCEKFKHQIDNEYKDKGMKNIIFDFKETNYIDESALGMVLGRYKRVSENSGNVFIAGAHSNVNDEFMKSDVYKIIKPYGSVDDVFEI